MNDGGAAADGRVTFQIPQGLAFQALRGAGWSCTVTGRVADCTGPAVVGGSSSVLQLDLVPARGAEGEAVLRGVVDPAGGGADLDPAACTGSGAPHAGCDLVRTVVGSTPHLVLGISGSATASVGAAATWTATVRDDGTGPAGTATVAFRLPDGLQQVAFSGASCTVTSRDAVCSVPGPIAVGASRSFTLTGTPSSASPALVVRGRLDPSGSAATGDPAACTAADASTGCAVSTAAAVGSGVALAVTIRPPTALTEGVPAGYAVGVRNSGSGPATAPIVSVHLPDGLAYRGAAGAACTRQGQDLTCTLPSAVPAGGSASFVVTVQPADGTAGTAVAPTASVAPSGTGAPAPASGCTASGSGCAVSAPRTIGRSGLVLTGTVTPLAPAGAQLAAGDRVRYGFIVANRTGAPLRAVVVTVPGLGTATCRATSLAPGASTTCELGPVTVTQAQVDAGSIARDATAAGTPSGCSGACSPVRSNTVTLAAPVKALARIAAVQTVHLHDTNGDGVAQLGELVDFSVRVANTGLVTLHGVRLDDALVHLVCPRTTLAVGESMVCTGEHVTTAADVAAGGIRNLATASARGVARLGTVSSQRTVGTVAADGPRAALAHTGSNLSTGLLAGFCLLGSGGVLLLAVRRRRSA